MSRFVTWSAIFGTNVGTDIAPPATATAVIESESAVTTIKVVSRVGRANRGRGSMDGLLQTRAAGPSLAESSLDGTIPESIKLVRTASCGDAAHRGHRPVGFAVRLERPQRRPDPA